MGDSAMGDSAMGDSAMTSSCADTGGDLTGWVELPLADWPELAAVGGYAYVDVDASLLHLIVAQPTEGCFIAVWRICSHGACDTEWDPAVLEATCPCHGSVFAADGAVLVGPATEPLRAFPIVRRGDSLFVSR